MQIRQLSIRSQVLLLAAAPSALSIALFSLIDFAPKPLSFSYLVFLAGLAAILFFFSLGVVVMGFGLVRFLTNLGNLSGKVRRS
jgi:hypothetical protein